MHISYDKVYSHLRQQNLQNISHKILYLKFNAKLVKNL